MSERLIGPSTGGSRGRSTARTALPLKTAKLLGRCRASAPWSRSNSRDGPGPFDPDPAFLGQHPDLAAMWRRSRDGRSAAIVVRNLYPPQVAGMSGAWRGLVCYAWEESGFPPDDVAAFNAHLDFITVISSFVAKVLRDNGVRVPIRVVGCGIDQITRLDRPPPTWWGRLRRTDRRSVRYAFDRAFCFLHVSTCLPRKGVDVLLAAWAKAFQRQDNVVLVIKASANQHHRIEDDVAALAASRPGLAPIVVITEHLAPAEMRALLERADVMVCPSRGEGFGLPLAEALALGKPLITTAYSGQMDFCTAQNGWLCDYDFAYAHSHVSVPGSVWAEPRFDSLVDCLRQAHAAPASERAARGARGRALVRGKFTWTAVAKRLTAAAADVKERAATARRLPRIGFVSPWNSCSPLADYARGLACAIPEARLAVFADRALPVVPDPAMVRRCWEAGDPLDALHECLRTAAVDAIVIQWAAGLYDPSALARLIERLSESGPAAVYVVCHQTAAIPPPLCAAFAKARRVLVHAVHDLNALKARGLVANTTLFPVGVPTTVRRETPPAPGPVIAAVGYLLPDKGFLELIEAFAFVRHRFPQASLRLLTYSPPHEPREREICEGAVRSFALSDAVDLRFDWWREPQLVAALAAADMVVYPYQRNRRSASAAVRLGLAALTPVVTTPLTMFDDVASVTHRLPGTRPHQIAAGLAELMSDPAHLQRHAQTQRAWVEAHSRDRVSCRLDALICGEFADAGHHSAGESFSAMPNS